jgi:hypothetical protein
MERVLFAARNARKVLEAFDKLFDFLFSLSLSLSLSFWLPQVKRMHCSSSVHSNSIFLLFLTSRVPHADSATISLRNKKTRSSLTVTRE